MTLNPGYTLCTPWQTVVHWILIASNILLTTQCCTMQQVLPCFTVNFIEPNKGSAFTLLQTVIKRQQRAGEGRLWVMVPSCTENTDTLQPTNSICLNLEAFGFTVSRPDEDWKKTSPQAWAFTGVMEFNLISSKLCTFPLYLGAATILCNRDISIQQLHLPFGSQSKCHKTQFRIIRGNDWNFHC